MAGRPLSPEAERIRDYLRQVRDLGTSVAVRQMARELQVAHRRAHDVVDYLTRRGEAVAVERVRWPGVNKPVFAYAGAAPTASAQMAMFDTLTRGIVRGGVRDV